MEKYWAFATEITQCQYGNELTPEQREYAKENNIVVVYGGSDDLVYFAGAIEDEVGCWDGGVLLFNRYGDIIDAKTGLNQFGEMPDNPCFNELTINCCPRGLDCYWSYDLDVDHALFRVYEDDELYCIGLVFQLDDCL